MAVVGLTCLPSTTVYAHPKGLLFPLIGAGSYSNDFNSPRGNALHHATDIFAPKRTKIVAAVAGHVTFVPITQPSYGYMVRVEDSQGFEYDYIHMNNDTPGTDDGKGGPFNAYAPDIYQGASVVRGQFLGYVGDSGNAEETVSHLHFEITDSNGKKVNPYPYLMEASHQSAPSIYPPIRNEVLPYGPSINTLSSIAIGKFDSSNTNQILVSPGQGYAPHVKVTKPDGSTINGFYAYNKSFTGGLSVGAGDIDGDGIDEIITGTLSGAPHVKATKLDGTVMASFYAYNPKFTGGVSVAAGDIDGDGKAEIITAAGPGGGPHVKVFKADGTLVTGFYAYSSTFGSGVSVAAGDVTGDSKAEIVTTPGPGGGAQVRILSGTGSSAGVTFNAYPGFTGGARVSVGNIRTSTDKAEIVTVPWSSGSPYMRMFNPANGSELTAYRYYDDWWVGGYNVAAGEGTSYMSIGGNRRTSLVSALK